VTETRGLRRAEFAVGAFGFTAFLLALIFVLDAARFHGDVLVDAVEELASGGPTTPHALLLALALFDLVALSRAAVSFSRGVSAHRRVAARLAVLRECEIAGRRVMIVASKEPLSFCAGLLRPRIVVSDGALARLSAGELEAVVAHEGHHADRRDPLRILVARAIGDAYSLRAFPRRERALGELAADAEAVRRGGRAALAGALLAFHGDHGIAPERVDRLAGTPPHDEVPRGLVAGAAIIIGALVALLAADVLVPGHPDVCLPLDSAPGLILCAISARIAALAPAWLGWRRAGAFLRPA
jgi:hypothetical protein